MKQSINLFLGSVLLLTLNSCGNAGGEKTEEAASTSSGQYFRFEVAGPESNIKHEFNLGNSVMSASQYEASGITNRIMASDGQYSVTINLSGNQPSQAGLLSNVNTVEIELAPGDLMMKLMGGNGTFNVKSLDPKGSAEGSFEGQLYLKRQLHDVKCEFRVPYPVVTPPTQEELDAKQRIIQESEAGRPTTIPVETKGDNPAQTREERKTR